MNPKTKTLLFSILVGGIVGALSGLVYYNANLRVDAEGTESVESPDAGTALKLGLSVLGFMRLIAE